MVLYRLYNLLRERTGGSHASGSAFILSIKETRPANESVLHLGPMSGMKKRPSLSLFIFMSLTLVTALSARDAACTVRDAWPDHLLIGIVPEVNIFKQRERYEHLAGYLSRKTGVKVGLTSLGDYGNVLASFRESRMDGAFLGSFTGALAHQRLKVDPIARPVTPDGRSTYHGLVFVRKDSGIRTVGDMKGKVMAFVDKASSCGFLFPMAFFRENGITDVNALFSEVFFVGSHDVAIETVLSGNADVGVAKNTVFEQMATERPQIREELLVLAASPEYPSHGFFLRRTLPPDLRMAIKEALLNMENDVEGQDALKAFGALRFVETDANHDYQTIFDTARKAGIDLKTFDYQEPEKQNLQFPPRFR